MTCGRTTFVAVKAFVVLILGSTISARLTTDESRNGGIATNSQRWNHQKNDREDRDNTEPLAMLAKRQFRRGVGDDLNALKDQAKKVNSVYKWIKKNWQKLFVIVVAIFALIAVVGIYRRCFSNSSSSGDEEEPRVVVVRMLKQDDKENNELKEPKVMEGGTQESSIGENKATVFDGTNNAIRRNGCDTTVTKKLPAGGTVHRDRSSALVATNGIGKIVERQVTGVKSARFSEFPNYYFPANSIPISGYTTYQQIECYNVYFYFTQYILNTKTIANQLKVQPTRVCEGSTSEGPFPVYGEVRLIKNLKASLMLKYCDDYIPTASTNTNLPLTVSP